MNKVSMKRNNLSTICIGGYSPSTRWERAILVDSSLVDSSLDNLLDYLRDNPLTSPRDCLSWPLKWYFIPVTLYIKIRVIFCDRTMTSKPRSRTWRITLQAETLFIESLYLLLLFAPHLRLPFYCLFIFRFLKRFL